MKAKQILHQLAIEQQYLTVDDIRDALEEEPRHFNQWGSLLNEAQAEGILVDTGRMVHTRRRDPAKNRKITLWESAYHRGPIHDPDPVAEYQRQRGVFDLFAGARR